MKEALRSMTEDMMAMIRRKDFAPFNLALSGGETAKHMFSLWVDEYKDKIDWNNIRFFWVDERCVPPTSPDSNYGHANHLLFKPLRIRRTISTGSRARTSRVPRRCVIHGS